METDFKVKIGQFEGPLDLLLDLIEKRKLHISEVSISAVADDFINFVKGFEDFPIADSSEFILIASTLLLIKSRSLLPNLNLTPEEKESIEDLEERLSNYKKYKELALQLSEFLKKPIYFAEERKRAATIFSPTPDITLKTLSDALSTALQNVPKQLEALPKIQVEKIVSLEEMIEKLVKKVQGSIKMNFSEFSKEHGGDSAKAEKINIIVSFLAMLELVKQGIIRVEQDKHFADMSIETDHVGVPKY